MEITLQYASGEKLLSLFTLDVFDLEERHTAEYIPKKLSETCYQWNIQKDKITAVVRDSGAKTVEANYIAFGKHLHILCCAHTLNLVAQRSNENTATLKELSGKVKSIVTWFKHTVLASDELRKRSPKKLISRSSNLLEFKILYVATIFRT